jgi:hypothetical protein
MAGRREEEAQLRRRQRRVGVKSDSEGSEDPRSTNRSVGHPRGWSCRSRFIVELELAIRAFANNEFKKGRLGHSADRPSEIPPKSLVHTTGPRAGRLVLVDCNRGRSIKAPAGLRMLCRKIRNEAVASFSKYSWARRE